MIYLFIIPILLILYIYLGLKKPAIALITCPIAAGTLLLFGAAEYDIIIMFSAGIIFLSAIIAILFSKSDPDHINWPKLIVRFFLFSLLVVLLLAVLISLYAPLGFIGIAFTVFLVGSIIAYFITARHSTAAYVISTIGSSIRQNLPLPMALESAASGQTDNRSKILIRIKKWLVQGCSLSESLKRGFRKCPGHAIAMIAAAERINQVPLAIEAIEANMTAQAKEKRKIRPVHPVYPVLVLCFTFFIIALLMLFVMPQYFASLSEMTEHGRLPAITLFVLNITKFILRDYGIIFLIILAIIILVIIPLGIYVRFRPRRPDNPHILSLIGDQIKWHLPILHWFDKNYSMIQVIEMIRLSLNAGCTVNDAIANTIVLDINCCFRKRLRKWLAKVEAGSNISESAEQSGLGAAIAWAFDDKVNQGNTISILEALESFYRSNYGYCVNLARFIMWPCIIIMLGVIVSIVVLSIFLPGIEIINHMVKLV
ncbi:MAG: type II secretion system F family protein [Sedimentisphaerales bacterium]|nr:type II secretion system F family protein [Sedimentisphaerales bacterium]